MAVAALPKASVYANRHDTSKVVPLALDSDSDFNPGAFVVAPKQKKRKRASPGKRVSKVADGSSADEDALPQPKRAKPLIRYETLRKIFQSTLDTDSEEEADDPGYRKDGPEEDMDDDEDEDEQQESDEEVDRRSAPKSIHLPSRLQLKADNHEESKRDDSSSVTESDSDVLGPPVIPLAVVATPQDDSVTESDPELDSILPPPVQRAEDDSVTESDPDIDNISLSDLFHGAQDSSETESDDEDPRESVQDLKQRPDFPLGEGQQPQGPLVLDEETRIAVPASINTYLRDYQRDGIRFFHRQFKAGRGGLLGDDMGLGKTIQIISFLSAIMKKTGLSTDRHRRREHVSQLQDGTTWAKYRKLPPANATWPTCLIIAPSTVVHNWAREFSTWGYFEVGVYMGTKEERQRVLKDFKMGRLDVVLTSFDLARRDIDLFDSLPWSCVVVDEVHRVKNAKSKITEAFARFETLIRFGLTGTAIQNDYTEFWNILHWTNPGSVGTRKEWKSIVSDPLKLGQSAAASLEQLARSTEIANIMKDKLLPALFLRRTKDIIANQMPKKIDNVVFCPLKPVQAEVYKQLLASDEVVNVVKRNDPCDCGSGDKRKDCCHPYHKGALFRNISILLKIANHLALILPAAVADNPEQLKLHREICRQVFPDGIPEFGDVIMSESYCGKWTVLHGLLYKWRKDPTNKVLVFTKSIKLLHMLEFHLNKRGYNFLTLEGETKQAARMPIIDQFNNDPDVFVFLISTAAGGTGLNLTAANKVVIFDPNWNPAHDLQAMDRAFRFGQKRDVWVYRLLGAGSIEELIYARQVYKQQQMEIGYNATVQRRFFDGVQGDKSRQGELFGIGNIFSYREDSIMTKGVIERARVAELDWALANMDTSKKTVRDKGTANLLDTETRAGGGEDGNFKGLGALLFDDAPPPRIAKTEEPGVGDVLGSSGVKYTHRNADLFAPSKMSEGMVAAERIKQKKIRKSTGKRKSTGNTDPGPPKPPWPPVRKHHKIKAKPTPEQQLAARTEALVSLGLISTPDDFATYAETFFQEPPDVQMDILRKLDQHKEDLAASSD